MVFLVLGLELGRGVMRKACLIKPSANERQKNRNTKQNGLSSASLWNKKQTLFCETMFWESSSVWFEKHVFIGTCAKKPINNLSQVTWLCTWFPTRGVADLCFDDVLFTVCAIPKQLTSRWQSGWTSACLIRETRFSETLLIISGWRRRMWKTISLCVSH